MSKKKVDELTLEIPVAKKLAAWDKSDLELTDPETGEKLGDDFQLNVGRALVRLLSVYQPKRPEEHILAFKTGSDITEAEESGALYIANERALGVLRKAYRQNGQGAKGPGQPTSGLFGVLVMGQLGLLLGLESKAESLEEVEESSETD